MIHTASTAHATDGRSLIAALLLLTCGCSSIGKLLEHERDRVIVEVAKDVVKDAVKGQINEFIDVQVDKYLPWVLGLLGIGGAAPAGHLLGRWRGRKQEAKENGTCQTGKTEAQRIRRKQSERGRLRRS